MSDKVLVIRCDGKTDFISLMVKLRNINDDIKWVEGNKLFDYNPYKDNSFLDNMTIYICIEKDKKVSYIINGTTIEEFRKEDMLYDLIISYNIDLGVTINKFLNDKSKIPFEDLKCGDFKHCEECPLHEFDCDFIQDTKKTFGEIMKNIGKTLEEAMNKYEKGEQICRI